MLYSLARNRNLTPNRNRCSVMFNPPRDYDYDYDYDKETAVCLLSFRAETIRAYVSAIRYSHPFRLRRNGMAVPVFLGVPARKTVTGSSGATLSESEGERRRACTALRSSFRPSQPKLARRWRAAASAE